MWIVLKLVSSEKKEIDSLYVVVSSCCILSVILVIKFRVVLMLCVFNVKAVLYLFVLYISSSSYVCFFVVPFKAVLYFSCCMLVILLLFCFLVLYFCFLCFAS